MSSRALLTWEHNQLTPLSSAWELAQSGRGQAILVGGEAGIGRTTLLASFRDQLGLAPERSLSLRCVELDSGVPYAPWIDLLDRAPGLAEAVPAPLGLAEPGVGSANELSRSVVRALIDWFSGEPAVITIDDTQYADEPSLVLLYRLIQSIADHPVLVLVAHTSPLRFDSPAAEFVPRMLVEGHASEIQLQPAGSGETEQALRRCCPDLDAESLPRAARLVLDLSGGNRLFLAELLRSLELLSPSSIADVQDHLRLLPTSLQSMIRYRLTQLPEDARQTIRFAAIIDERIDLDLLEAVSGNDTDTLLDQLETAIERGLLVEMSDGDTYFRHGVVRQTLIEEISALRRRRVHSQIHAALIQRGGKPQAIAFHALAAGASAAALEALENAGDNAMRVFALEEAAVFFQRAIQVADSAGVEDERIDNVRLAYFDSIWLTDRDLASVELNRVIARAAIREDSELKAKADFRRAMILYESGQLAQARTLLYELIPALKALAEPELLAEALAYCGFCASTLSDFFELERIADQLLELSSEIGNAQFRAVAMHLSAHAMVGLGKDVEQASTVGRESVEILVELGRLEFATSFAWVIFTSVDVPSNLHDPDAVEQLVERGIELNRDSDRLAGTETPECLCPFSYWYFLQGDWNQARELMLDPIANRQAAWSQTQKDIVHGIAAEMALAEGRYDDTIDLLNYLAADPSAQIGSHSFRQWILAVERWVKLAVDQLEIDLAREWVQTLDQALEERPYVPGELILDTLRARIDLSDGDNDLQSTADLMDRTAARALQTHNMIAYIDALCLQAQALSRSGEIDRALRRVGLAIDTARNCGLRYHQAWAHLYRAEIGFVDAGSRDDYVIDIETATEIFEDLGAKAGLSRLDRLRSRYSRRSNVAGLTNREIEVVRLVAEGRTDVEIGEALYISPRTVSTHISNMLNKTGTNNRVELTAWAIANAVVAR